MKVTIDIPDAMQQPLQEQLGLNLGQAAKEAMAILLYREEKLSIGQVAELLGLSVYQAEGFMKERRIEAPYSLDDYDQDSQSLDKILNP
jgi:predicted HTH domain antitoxin